MKRLFAIAALLSGVVFAQQQQYPAPAGGSGGTGCIPTGGAGRFIVTTAVVGNCDSTGTATGAVTFIGTPTSANLAALVTDETGSGALVFGTSPTLTTPNLGTPSAITLTNATGLPIGGITGLGAGIGTFLATPSSANLAAAITNETGSGALVFGTSPTISGLVLGDVTGSTQCLHASSLGVITGTGSDCGSGGSTAFSALTGSTNTTAAMVVGTGASLATSGSGTIAATSAPLSGVSGLGAGVGAFLGTPSSANLASAVTDETGSGLLVFATSPVFTTPNLGTPSAVTLTNGTGLPISTGVSGLGTGISTFLATPSSANLASAITNETGSGALVFGTQPTIDKAVITSYTVATLPTPATGMIVPITDGNSATDCTSGGGTNRLWCRYSGSAWQALAASAGSGTVTVVSSGSLTSTAFVTGGGTTTLQTPSATSTLDSSGNAVFTGTVTGSAFISGSGPSVTIGTGGVDAYGEGTAPSVCAAASVDCVYADSTRHGLMASYNNGSYSILTRGPSSSTSGNLPSFNGTNGDLLQDSGVAIANLRKRAIAFTMGDVTNSGALSTSNVSYVTVPFACTISAYNLTIDAGTITVKFWKVATGTAIPTSGNSINTSGVSISSGTAIHSTTVSDFTTTAVSANDIMAMAVTSVATAKTVTGVLECTQ